MAKVPSNNEIVKFCYSHGAEGVRVVQQTSRMISLDIISRRDYWEKDIEPTLIAEWEGEILSIQKVSGDPKVKAVETGGGTFRYRVILVRF